MNITLVDSLRSLLSYGEEFDSKALSGEAGAGPVFLHAGPIDLESAPKPMQEA